MHRAADIAASLYPPSDDPSADRRTLVFAYWATAAGEKLSEVTRPLEMRGKTLWVGVEPGPWLNELDAVRERIRKKINRGLGSEAVSAIRFRPAASRTEPESATDSEADDRLGKP